MVRRARFADGTPKPPPPKPERNFFDKLKTLKQVSKGISPESRIRLLDYFIQEALTKGQLTEEQASGIYNQLREDKDKIREQIDTYERENFKKGTALGPRDKIDQLGVGEQVLKEYSEGAGTIELGKKYGVSRDTINRYIKKFNPNLIRESLPKVNQFNFDYSILDQIREDAKTMSRKEILEKYEGKISKKRLDKEKLTFGKVEESGRPRVPPGERSPKNIKRAARIKNVQGFDVSGSFAKNFHHIFPIGGYAKFSPQDTMLLDKKFNEILGGFNLQLNDLADEIVDLDLNTKEGRTRLNEINKESKELVTRAKNKLPKNLQNAIGFIEYQPIFDENGTVINVSSVRQGVDDFSDTFSEFSKKKFKDFSPEEKLSFKKFVKELANSKAFKVGKGLAKGVTRTVGASLPVIGGGFVALGVNDVAKAAEMGIVSPDELAVAYNFGPEAAQLFKDYKAEEMKPTLAGKKDTPAIDDYTGNKLFGNYNEQIKNIKLP